MKLNRKGEAMKRILKRRPSAALIISVVALVVGLGGTAVAGNKLGLGALSDGAKNKTVGVGKITYVTNTVGATGPEQSVTVNCPSGLHAIGGGIKLSEPNVTGDSSWVEDSYPTVAGWAGHVFFDNAGQSATAVAVCATSRVVTGSPPNG
jgi:hypothetical protein